MSDEIVSVPRKRLEELLAIEAAYLEEHAPPPAPTLADRFNAFRTRVAKNDRRDE